MTPNDDSLNFILSSWLNSFRTSGFAKNITDPVYFDEHEALIRRLLKRGKCVLAVDRDDSAHIYGWCCAEYIGPMPCLHFIYLKHPYRALGLALLLMSASIPESVRLGPEDKGSHRFLYTHETMSMPRVNPHGDGTYWPYALWRDNGIFETSGHV